MLACSNRIFAWRYFASTSSGLSAQRLRQAYFSLDLEENAEIEEVRQRYAQLIRRFHPDTGGKEANPERLEQVRNAYKLIIRTVCEEEPEEDVEEKDFDIHHTAPQHRQYLEYGGLGIGTPSARQRQYQQYRVSNALENVREFTIQKSIRESCSSTNADLIAVNEQRKRRKKQLTGMLDRIVEDMILSGMATGEFSNLKGAGKPLKMDQTNPYIDGTQQRINRILRDNGFAPPWIVKENDLRKQLEEYRKRIRVELAQRIVENDIVAEDLTEANVQNLMSSCLFIEKELIEINKLIQNYNLIAPSMDRQFMPLRSDRELKRARDELIKEFPNSPFIIEARRKFERVGKHTNTEEPKGFLKNFINRFY